LSSAFTRPDWGGVLDLKSGEATQHYRAGVVIVAFDLRFSLTEQLTKTKAMLEDERRSLGIEPLVERIHGPRWAVYLRVIDARASGVVLRTIGASILGHENLDRNEQAARARQCLTDAEHLQAKIIG